MGVQMMAAPRPGALRKESALYEELVERLQSMPSSGTVVRMAVPLARHTTFGIGGPADVFVTVTSANELARVVREVRAAGAPLFILGSGSNVLVGDRGIRGVVLDNQAKALNVGETARPLGGEARIEVESGASFAAVARQLSREGYAGIEWACGIPGTLGGAVVYNAGAYDGCLADVLLFVTLIDAAGAVRRLPANELGLSYRSSAILRGELASAVVLSVELALRRGDQQTALARVAELDRQRLDAQPRGRNSGSVFKNPPGKHAWQLIDAAGLRGHRVGDARVSEKHCNFIENIGSATAADVAALIVEAQTRVREHFGVELEREVEFVGEGFGDSEALI